jgi:hypothetical protein
MPPSSTKESTRGGFGSETKSMNGDIFNTISGAGSMSGDCSRGMGVGLGDIDEDIRFNKSDRNALNGADTISNHGGSNLIDMHNKIQSLINSQ